LRGRPSDLEWSVKVEAMERARILRGWTRRQLAQQAHVDEGTLCDLFAGRRRPTFGTLRALCQALEISLEDVISIAQVHGGGRWNVPTY
jgi:transcriptional regulator with XRE-family HTH domain